MYNLTIEENMKKEILKHVLHLMDDKHIALQKITIQKIVYFLREVGIPLKYKYEPYIYGPYSSDLKSDLRSLMMWDDLSQSGDDYCFKNDLKLETSIDKAYSALIANKIDEFSTAIKNDFSFDSMEITGTVIYCNQALKNAGIQPDESKVLDEFKNWKGSRYTVEQIKAAYANISPLLNLYVPES